MRSLCGGLSTFAIHDGGVCQRERKKGGKNPDYDQKEREKKVYSAAPLLALRRRLFTSNIFHPTPYLHVALTLVPTKVTFGLRPMNTRKLLIVHREVNTIVSRYSALYVCMYICMYVVQSVVFTSFSAHKTVQLCI